MTAPVSPALRWLFLMPLAAASLALAGCGAGNDNPFAGDAGEQAKASTPAATAVLPTGDAAAPTGDGGDVGSPPVDPLPSNPAAAPGPADEPATSTPSAPSGEPATPDAATTDLQEAIAQDEQAKLNVRTMVSVVEGCHSGRESYKDCNTQDELGDPKVLGLTVGKGKGELKISASPRGFRVTAYSESGAKFTVARGPGGDRFRCIAGPKPGACPADRTWSW